MVHCENHTLKIYTQILIAITSLTPCDSSNPRLLQPKPDQVFRGGGLVDGVAAKNAKSWGVG